MTQAVARLENEIGRPLFRRLVEGMVPTGIGDVAGLPRLIEALRHHGYDEPLLRKIAHENWLALLQRTWGG